MTDQQAAGADEPVNIDARGPQNAARQTTVTRTFDNNADAVDAKQAEAIKAQTAPNPTTDVELAKQAYGDDWNKRRGHKVIGATRDGDPIYNHGGVAVDDAGHALGHASDPERAADLRERLVHGPEATEADRYPVTEEARREHEQGEQGDGAGEDGAYSDWTVEQMRAELHRRELPVSGNKPELLQRLRDNDSEGSDES